ncbi:MAG: hypothetical protein OSB09_09705 [Planctomycetota bacterium]|nr:hypothetical protein [Planctomycetota bacterium]
MNFDRGRTAVTADHRDFLQRLSKQEKTLLIIREELYEGSWTEMTTDLEARLEKGPHVFELSETIEADIARIHKLTEYELQHDIDLGEYLEDDQ